MDIHVDVSGESYANLSDLVSSLKDQIEAYYNQSKPYDVCEETTYGYKDLTQIAWVRIVFLIVYLVVMFLSLVGNFLVIWTVYSNKHMRTVTNYYIVNLATCDLLVAMFVLPLKLLEYVAPCSWHVFGHDSLCAVVNFTLPVFVFASVLTLVAISLERYYAIVYPLKAKIISGKSRTRCIIAITWIIAVVLATPFLYCRSYAFNIHSEFGTIRRQICNDRFDEIDFMILGKNGYGSGSFRKWFFIFLFVMMYIVPSVLITYTCVHMIITLLRPLNLEEGRQSHRRVEDSKRKVARMIVTVAGAFLVCWTPFYLVNIISQNQQSSFLRESNFLLTMLSTHLVGFLNSCVNPFIYFFLSAKFRTSFRNILLNNACFSFIVRPKRRPTLTCVNQRSTSCAMSMTQAAVSKLPRLSWRTSAQYKAGTGNGLTGSCDLLDDGHDSMADETPKLILKSSVTQNGTVELTYETMEGKLETKLYKHSESPSVYTDPLPVTDYKCVSPAPSVRSAHT